MNLLYPAFLFALVSLAIPVIIHLFNFRKFKKIYFTNVRFLHEVKRETHAKNSLKHLLVLICRILALLFLVLAFAQPYIPFENRKALKGSRALSIYIDNSFSMDAVSAGGRMFDRARQTAIDIVKSSRPSDVFQLITNEDNGIYRRFVNRDEFNRMLDEVELSPVVRSISETVLRQEEALADVHVAGKEIFLISDFQKNIADIKNIRKDSTCHINFIPLTQDHPGNIFIDSCWFETPYRLLNQPEKLHVRIRNNSTENVENLPIRLFLNNKQKALGGCSIKAGTFADTILSFTILKAGFQRCRVQIKDYPVTFDDDYFFSIDISEHLKVLSISENDSNKFINALFAKDDFVTVENARAAILDYSLFHNYNLIVIEGLYEISSGFGSAIMQFIQNGGSVLLSPGKNISLDSYKNFLSQVHADYYTSLDTSATEVIKINWEDPLYYNVFDKVPENINLPKVHKHYKLSANIKCEATPLLIMQNSDPFLSFYRFGKGSLYIAAVSIDDSFSNFHRHAIFVPTIYNMALHSEISGELAYTIGEDKTIDLAEKEDITAEVYHILSSAAHTDFIPGISRTKYSSSIVLHQGITKAGHYFITAEKDTIKCIAFNYDRKESDLSTLDAESIEKISHKNGNDNISVLGNGEQHEVLNFAEIQEGKKYWKHCVIFTLLFLALETLLLKYWKK